MIDQEGFEAKGHPNGNTLILPRKVYVLAGDETNIEQFNIYFRNIITGYYQDKIIDVECEYGWQYEEFWRLEPGNTKAKHHAAASGSFPLTVKIMDQNYNLLAKASTTVEIVDPSSADDCFVLCLGDSITRGHLYVQHLQEKLPQVRSVGIRTYDDGEVCMEGRGGWSAESYFQSGSPTGAESPFMFPVGVEGSQYRGNTNFWRNVGYVDPEGYDYMGFQKIARGWAPEGNPYSYDESGYPVSPEAGDAVYDPEREQLLFWNGETWIASDEQPVWEFSFAKYIERNKAAFLHNGRFCSPNIVSILLGANDLQAIHDLDAFISGLTRIIESVKAYDASIRIILNLPCIGANQDGFGCSKTSEWYRRLIQEGCRRILEMWDNDPSLAEGIYISPMLLALDPVFGYDFKFEPANKYASGQARRANNNVHPNLGGHRQMGDALAGVVQHIRNGFGSARAGGRETAWSKI